MSRNIAIAAVIIGVVVALIIIGLAMFSGGSVEGVGAAAAALGTAAAMAAKVSRDASREELDTIADEAKDGNAELKQLKQDHQSSNDQIDEDVSNRSLADLVDEENHRT